MRTTLLSLLFFTFILAGCNQNSTQDNKAATTPPPTATTPTANTTPQLPGITQAVADELWQKCDHIDYIYYNLKISMNIDNQKSARQCLQQIGGVGTTINDQCKAFAHLVYLHDGDIMYEAEVFFSEGCTYFVFYKDDKPLYANAMSQVGHAFFTKAITDFNNR